LYFGICLSFEICDLFGICNLLFAICLGFVICSLGFVCVFQSRTGGMFVFWDLLFGIYVPALSGQLSLLNNQHIILP
jgi:hypothetical protein